MGPYQLSFQQQIRFYSKIFSNKLCCYNEGPLYEYMYVRFCYPILNIVRVIFMLDTRVMGKTS